MPEHERDPELSPVAREAVIAAITTESSTSMTRTTSSLVGAAVTLRAMLPDVEDLTGPERALMNEWLDRITDRSR
jgi:hypothetical protein